MNNAGQLLGGAAGAGIGAAFGGAQGAQMGWQLGNTAGQFVDAHISKKKAEESTPPLEDPEVRSFLNEIDLKRKSINTGSAFATGAREVDQAQAAANDSIVKVTGGNVGSTIEALNRSQRSAGTNMNSVLAEGARQEMFFTNMASDLLKGISDRKLQLQLANKSQHMAEWAQTQQDAAGNMGAMVSNGSFDDMFSKIYSMTNSGSSGPNYTNQPAGSTPPFVSEGTQRQMELDSMVEATA